MSPTPNESNQFASQQVHRLLERLAFQVGHAAHSHDAAAVHDLRVAIRRFAQALAVFKPCFPPKPARKIRRSLKDLLALAGDVRNCDITLEYLAESDAPAAGRLTAALQVIRRQNVHDLQLAVRHWLARKTFSKWRDELAAVRLPNGPPHPTTGEVARHELRRLAKRFFGHGERAAHAKASAGEMHQFRIAAKKFRYGIELFAPFYGRTASEWLRRIAAVQSALGRVNDCRTARAAISRAGGDRRIEAALKKKQGRKAGEFRNLWREQFADPHTAAQWLERLSRTPRKPVGRSTGPARKASSVAKTG